jgi:hypothetical protein
VTTQRMRFGLAFGQERFENLPYRFKTILHGFDLLVMSRFLHGTFGIILAAAF